MALPPESVVKMALKEAGDMSYVEALRAVKSRTTRDRISGFSRRYGVNTKGNLRVALAKLAGDGTPHQNRDNALLALAEAATLHARRLASLAAQKRDRQGLQEQRRLQLIADKQREVEPTPERPQPTGDRALHFMATRTMGELMAACNSSNHEKRELFQKSANQSLMQAYTKDPQTEASVFRNWEIEPVNVALDELWNRLYESDPRWTAETLGKLFAIAYEIIGDATNSGFAPVIEYQSPKVIQELANVSN